MLQKKEITAGGDVSILSTGVRIEGKFYSEGNVRIDGKIMGDVIVNGNLTLGESSKINGTVKARNITISGALHGNINATEKVILESKSVLKGDLVAKILVVEEGAKFDGQSKMGDIPAVPPANAPAK
jgi:cytoskeletal protein CcmA (bactofilin family)